MFFLSSLGFFSLICLLIQCGLAWVFAAFLGALSGGGPRWAHSFFVAFVGMAIGLTALSVRFVLAHVQITGASLPEGELGVRALYGTYLAGKLLFVGGVVRGARAWSVAEARPSVPVLALLVGAGALVGFALPTIESILLVQGPFVVVGAGIACAQLRGDGPAVDRVGRRAVRGVLSVMAGMWALYVVATLFANPLDPQGLQPLGFLLRYNSLIDLLIEVVLATGIVIAVMADATGRVERAQRERDRLQRKLDHDDKLRVTATLISGVAHEINNPLTAILGYAEDLRSDDPAARDRAVDVVREQAERCRHIVQRMTAAGRRRLLSAVEFRVEDQLQRIRTAMARQADERGVRLRLDVEDFVVVADVTGFEQVTTNLVANAIQVTPRGGDVVLGARRTARGAVVWVLDDGPGVPAGERTRIFEPFWTSRRSGEGTGLGLAVADAIVHAHEGRIEVSDGRDGGACFEVTWPWRTPTRAPEDHDAGAAGPQAVEGGARLLIVDDEPLVRSTIRRHAERRGWTVDEVDSAEPALRRLLDEQVEYDAVVCDMRMPGMSGAEFHDRLAERAPALLARTLFVTGDLASVEADAFAARCRAGIVTKPFEVDDLFERLRALTRAG